MCLSIVLRGKEKKAALAKLKDTITVWKVLCKPDKPGGCYMTDCMHTPIYAGEVKFKQNIIGNDEWNCGYRGGGHFWLTKASALSWGVIGNEKLVKCAIKKSDINTIGYQYHLVVVVKKATFPKYIGKKKE